MKHKFRTLVVFLAAALSGAVMLAAQNNNAGPSNRPNILLIIGDDIGMDVTTDMYPGLIDALVKEYGPQGLNHTPANPEWHFCRLTEVVATQSFMKNLPK